MKFKLRRDVSYFGNIPAHLQQLAYNPVLVTVYCYQQFAYLFTEQEREGKGE